MRKKVYKCPNCGANAEDEQFFEAVVYLVAVKVEDDRIIRDVIDQPLGAPMLDGRYSCSNCGAEFDEFVEEYIEE